MKKNCFQLKVNSFLFSAIMIFFIFGNDLLAQGGWGKKADLPIPRAKAGVVALNGKIYVIGGELTPSPTFIVHVYDVSTDSWETIAPLSVALHSMGVAVLNGKIYCAGGRSASGWVKTCYQYDPSKDQWLSKADMPGNFTGLPVAEVGSNGKLYLFGQWSYSRQAYQYDPQSDTWNSITGMPWPRNNAASATIGDFIYVAGGERQYYGVSDALEVFNCTNSSWSALPSMLAARTEVTGAAINGKFYVIGGKNSDHVLNLNEEYDPASYLWRQLSPMPTPRYGMGAAVVDGKIYVIGGDTSITAFKPTGVNEVFDPLFVPVLREQLSDVPGSCSLFQNHPNPFNPETIIQYQLPKISKVKLSVYNLVGQLIATLIDENQPAGYYSVLWDGKDDSGRNLASGVYFYKIQAYDFVEVRKMLLIN